MTKPASELIALADDLSFAAENTQGCLYSQRKMLHAAAEALRTTAKRAIRERIEAEDRATPPAQPAPASERYRLSYYGDFTPITVRGSSSETHGKPDGAMREDDGLFAREYPLPLEHYEREARNLTALWAPRNKGAYTCILVALLKAAHFPGDVVAMKEALKFYANPDNWMDTPSWDDGDPDCITPKAIPFWNEPGRPFDCGDIARKALAALHSPKIAAAETSPGDAEARDNDIGILLSALRMHEEATGETFDDCGGMIAQIEADHKARQPVLIAAAIDRLDVRVEAKSAEADEEKELFAAVTKIDLAGAVKHLRNWAAYKANEHCQEYANLIEAQARLIAWFVKERAIKVEAKSQEPDAVAIKPLEWTEDTSLLPNRQQWIAGDYRICKTIWSNELTVYDVARGHWLSSGPHKFLDEAKAAAQEDYEQRIRSALIHPTTKPEAPAVSVDAETIDAVARIIDPTAWKMEHGYWMEQAHAYEAISKAIAIAALIAGGR